MSPILDSDPEGAVDTCIGVNDSVRDGVHLMRDTDAI